jgi:ketosteroid isomerase-like protein
VSRENVEIVRGQYEAVNRRDWAAVMDYYDDDVVLVAHMGPDAGTFNGRQAVGSWFGDWFVSFGRDYQFEIEEVLSVGDRVLVVQRHQGRGRTSGIELEWTNASVFSLRVGRIVRVELYGSRARAVEALGRRE